MYLSRLRTSHHLTFRVLTLLDSTLPGSYSPGFLPSLVPNPNPRSGPKTYGPLWRRAAYVTASQPMRQSMCAGLRQSMCANLCVRLYHSICTQVCAPASARRIIVFAIYHDCINHIGLHYGFLFSLVFTLLSSYPHSSYSPGLLPCEF